MVCQEPERQLYEAILKASFQEEHLADLFQYRHDNGVVLELDVTTWSVSDGIGNIISHVALIRDVSYEMQLESQLRRAQRMEAIGTLAGGIAHDFNNTLAFVITCTEMALEE